MIGAHPGSGKTFLMCYMVACVSTGRSLFGLIPLDSEPENSIYITAEDGLGDTIKKRMRLNGANMKKIFSPKDNGASLTFDDPKLEEIIKTIKPALVVFDPFQAFIGENVDMNSPNKTRTKLNNLVDLAEKYNVSIVLVCHFNKNNNGEAITRILGSMDITGICRSFLSVGNVPRQKGKKFMSHEKSSLAADGKTILFHIDDGKIVYDGESDMKMEDYAAEGRTNKGRHNNALEAAKAFLISNIPDGKRPAKELQVLAEANNISYDTLNRARNELGIKSIQNGFGGEYIWYTPKDISILQSVK